MKYKSYRKPYRVKRKKSILKSRFFWLGILFLIFAGAFFYFFVFSSFFQIKKIIVTGEEKVSKENIKAVVEADLQKKFLVFPTKSIFLVNLNKVKEDILNKFPQVAEAEIHRGFPDSLDILLVERFGLATWCQEGHCFSLDNEGIIFEETEAKENLPKIIARENKTSILGEKVIEKDYLEKILRIQKFFQEELKLEIKEFIAFSQRLNLRMAEGFEIYFDPREDINWQLTKLNLVLKEKIPFERRKDLEYIELRFDDLATFRYKD